MFDEDIRDDIRRMRKQMNRAFRNFGSLFSDKIVYFDKELDTHYRNPWTEVKETKDEYVIEVELPGVEKQDIMLDITDMGLEIKAEKNKVKKHEDKEKGQYAYAKSYAGFSRVVSLPENANKDKIKANFKNGVLTVKLKKRESKKHKGVKID